MKVAINGFGRIGRLVFRIMDDDPEIEVVAINFLKDVKQLAYLLKYDSTFGKYKTEEITYEDNYLIIGSKKILIVSEEDPQNLPWEELDIDMVFECTGKFTKEEDANKHILSGAKKVLVSAPSKGNVKTIVYSVNEKILTGDEKIVSASSCTTNCLAPILNVVNENFGIKKGFMTTIHAITNDQTILDGTHSKGSEGRRGRTAITNIIPTSTGAAESIGLVLPELEGRMKGAAMRVPTVDGSCVDLVLELERNVSIPIINNIFINAKNEVLDATYDPIVSSDVIGSTYGAVVDLSLTEVLDVDSKQLVKIVGWYDNEYGYSKQMVRTAKYWWSLNK